MLTNPFQPGLLARLPSTPEKVAILCASRIGDFLCALPAIRALRRELPDSRCTLIALPFIKETALRSGYIDDFAAFPGFPGIAEQFFDAGRCAAFFALMQQKKFDLAIQLHGSGVYSNVFTLMLGARTAAGFIRTGDGPGRLDAALSWPSSLHAVRRCLALAAFIGARALDDRLEFPVAAAERDQALGLLAAFPTPFIALHAGSRERSKIWPRERFIAVGTALRQTHDGTILVLGGPDEQAGGADITGALGPPALNLAGSMPLGLMAAVMQQASLIVTNDSGPAHIAYALAVPSITLFGETDPAEWGPPSRARHQVLRASDCRMSSISVEEVLQKADQIIARNGNDRRKPGIERGQNF